MEAIIIILSRPGFFIIFNRERILSGETVVGFSDDIRVTDGPASIPRIKGSGETFDISQFRTDINGVFRLVKKNRKDRLCGTCVVNYLVCEEQITVIIFLAFSFFWILLPLEQENQPVYWPIYHSKKIG